MDAVTPNPEAELAPFEDATPLLRDPASLRAQAARDGFLFFRGLLDPAAVLGLRHALLEVLGRHGLLAAGSRSGKLDMEQLALIPAADMRLDIGVTAELYLQLQRLPQLHRLPHHPALLQLYRALLDDEIFVHPRHILRAMTSHPATGATPPHQDFPLVQGSPETWTCWFPVGDCSRRLGPLTVLRGSHRDGYLPAGNDYGADGSVTGRGYWTAWGAQLCDHDSDWVGGDFSTGDVLTFPAFTVHRSLRSSIRDQIRLSMDVRYQRAREPIDEASLTNHSDRPWDEIYDGWSPADHDLMYYWEAERPPLSPWDESLLEPGRRRIC